MIIAVTLYVSKFGHCLSPSSRELAIFALIAKQFLMLPVGFGHLSASCPIFWQKAPGNTLTLQ